MLSRTGTVEHQQLLKSDFFPILPSHKNNFLDQDQQS
jgi:hypothetical protein